jgi:serine phosphatase RsbU (regulator of sigma subunit)
MKDNFDFRCNYPNLRTEPNILKIVFMLKNILLFFILVLPPICFSQSGKYAVTFRVISNVLTDSGEVYITGNRTELSNWNPGRVEMHRQTDSSWTITLAFPSGTHLEYKFTRGSWVTEAVNENGIEYPSFSLDVKRDTLATYHIPFWRDNFKTKNLISTERFNHKSGRIELFSGWKYHPGDNINWKDPNIDDSSWETVYSSLNRGNLPSSGWDGIGWFRIHLTVDSSLWNKPLAFTFEQAGASEVYLNGKQLYKFGTVSDSPDKEENYQDNIPRYIQFPPQSQQVLAVRYSNHATEKFYHVGGYAGFNFVLFKDLNQYIENTASHIRQLTLYQTIFTVLPLALVLIHLLLFSFYPKARENLYFSISMIGWIFVVFADYQWAFSTNPSRNIVIGTIAGFAGLLALFFGIMTAYQSVYGYLLKRLYYFGLAGLIVFFVGFILPNSKTTDIILIMYVAIVAMEIFRVFLFPGKQMERKRWIIGSGFIFLMLILLYQLFISLQVFNPIGGYGMVYVYGILFLAITVSIDLSINYAKTNRNLEQKLIQVQELSHKSQEQEQKAREEEINLRILEADNARKTQELEEARRLQLSMLPQKVPRISGLDIAAHMDTATEVGGDYYDFQMLDDGNLIAAIGDATGHGLKAAIMVALIKNVFNSMGHTFFIPDIFNHCTKLIKRMNLGNLYMGLTIARIRGNKMTISAAGMPPVLIFRQKEQAVEEVILKGLPLGGQIGFTYDQRIIDLAKGDVLLFMTDGYPELFNENWETLDYDLVKEYFLESVNKSPVEIIRQLCEAGRKWRKDQNQNDDITFVVIKVI